MERIQNVHTRETIDTQTLVICVGGNDYLDVISIDVFGILHSVLHLLDGPLTSFADLYYLAAEGVGP
ncbi:hypothetical protein MT325_m374L [Paramecium bursaria chlorella virus MT325]|uniref:Uncharacterized protein m374L n=1 Tax=Paramecium bursaria Chlorella virus MT325 TaxID=346932 RepID=A7IUA4_PBCVM|nr:hypothetical protein MT325_m374L [Paramecium bursaria chlorella virus MT325]